MMFQLVFSSTKHLFWLFFPIHAHIITFIHPLLCEVIYFTGWKVRLQVMISTDLLPTHCLISNYLLRATDTLVKIHSVLNLNSGLTEEKESYWPAFQSYRPLGNWRDAVAGTLADRVPACESFPSGWRREQWRPTTAARQEARLGLPLRGQ